MKSLIHRLFGSLWIVSLFTCSVIIIDTGHAFSLHRSSMISTATAATRSSKSRSLFLLHMSYQPDDDDTMVKSSSSSRTTTTTTSSTEAAARAALERTAAHLKRLKNNNNNSGNNNINDNNNNKHGAEMEQLYRQYVLQSANSLKEELKSRNLAKSGRKPDLARRLAQHDVFLKHGHYDHNDDENDENDDAVEEASGSSWIVDDGNNDDNSLVTRFCGLELTSQASVALSRANFRHPSPIQKSAIPFVMDGESCILHAETGSGKTLAYLLPITEQLWYEHEEERQSVQLLDDGDDGRSDDDTIVSHKNHGKKPSFRVLLTPTRELAAQIAGIASVLAPPGTVRLMSHPTNMMRDGQKAKERGEERYGGRMERDYEGRADATKLWIGSAKTIHASLFGHEKLPASPTSKPEAQYFLRNVRCLILDEVDRLLNIQNTKTKGGKKKARSSGKNHEKPAAILAAAVTRQTLGRAQIVSASATVGRPLKRELSRVLGLLPQECPSVVVAAGKNTDNDDDDEDIYDDDSYYKNNNNSNKSSRKVTIPDTVQHYIYTPPQAMMNNNNGATGNSKDDSGKLLTLAFSVIQAMSQQKQKKRILLVLTRGFGISTQNVIGALKHFNCQPEPISLLDALEVPYGGGTDHMIEIYRQVSKATGIGETFSNNEDDTTKTASNNNNNNNNNDNDNGYLLVTGEDTVRGLHFDQLDIVLIVGRCKGPDEYTHIAGRTGRAGRKGTVINIMNAAPVGGQQSKPGGGGRMSDIQKQKVWEKLLNIQFHVLDSIQDVRKNIL